MAFYSSPFGHDWAWEREVVRRIRAGGAAPQADSDYVGPPQSHWADPSFGSPDIRTGIVYLQKDDERRQAEREALRQEMRDSFRDAQAQAAANAKQKRIDAKARRQAQDAALREWQAGTAERARRAREAHEAWEKEEQRLLEEQRVLTSKWSCTICKGRAAIAKHKEGDDDGYMLTCLSCGKQAWGKHSSLMEVVNR